MATKSLIPEQTERKTVVTGVKQTGDGTSWHVDLEVRQGDEVLESHTVDIDVASLALQPEVYEAEYPEAVAAIREQ